MPVKIDGLPAHVLLIHAVVVLLPLGAIMVVLSAVWPAARRKLGFLTPAVALVGLILVPITTHAGEWLEARLPHSEAIEHHADLGDTLLPWAAGMFVVAVVVWVLGRRYDMGWQRSTEPEPGTTAPVDGGGGTAILTRPSDVRTRQSLPVWVTAVVAVAAIAVSTGVSVQLYRIGESGAKAVWSGVADLPANGGS